MLVERAELNLQAALYIGYTNGDNCPGVLLEVERSGIRCRASDE